MVRYSKKLNSCTKKCHIYSQVAENSKIYCNHQKQKNQNVQLQKYYESMANLIGVR